MRIVSWNINGIRTLPQYHPWNTLKTCEAILDELNADIVCFQEMKTSRTTLDRSIATPGKYDAFFSFPSSKGGYSGVAVYANSSNALPVKAEEGLSGRLQPKPPFSQEERIASSYPDPDNMVLVPDEEGHIPSDLGELDQEGRGLLVDFGLFVLINLYCPNESSDTRRSYKLNYHLMLEERVKRLIQDGREVIVTGDMNICAAPIDHCDGSLASRANEFWEHPARAWFREWLHPRGPMVDVIRNCWPERQGMYTCWNTKISARESNYGTRIDYFLLTKGLLKWFKHGDIQPSLKGSDHCPVFIELHDEITTETGETLTLRNAMKMDGPPRESPRIAAKNWDEFSGKQKLLSTFFGKKSNSTASSETKLAEITQQPKTSVDMAQGLSASQPLTHPNHPETKTALRDSPPPPQPPSSSPPVLSQSSQTHTPSTALSIDASASASTAKRKKKMQADSNYPAQPTKKQKKPQKTGQTQLSTFFSKPAKASSTEKNCAEPSSSGAVVDVENDTLPTTKSPYTSTEDDNTSQMDSDFALAQQLSESQETSATPVERLSGGGKQAWSTLFAPLKPPNCMIHREPAKEFTVNKPGPNKGKTFFICSRPVGPGYDAGKAYRLREEVDPRYRCNFFKWSSEVKKESLREAKHGQND
ncbi:DNase I-like protein [Rickenella mellea]|uniref:DNA-(apurinic or apyrimidinic site) endonuclease n=1 Tax=Rickenella mellea TaxID=50990 RepID=A0A4Y7Q886_9AGAM|nr:DNase I-like protein [Rickenella mellea]